MQKRDVTRAAPIAAIKAIGPDKIQRARNRAVIVKGKKQDNAVAHAVANDVKKCTRQIRRPPFARACVLIEYPECVPMIRRDVSPGNHLDPDCGLRARAFLADGLALARRQRAQKAFKVRIIAVLPMKLRAHARQPSGGAKCLEFGCLDKGGMRR